MNPLQKNKTILAMTSVGLTIFLLTILLSGCKRETLDQGNEAAKKNNVKEAKMGDDYSILKTEELKKNILNQIQENLSEGHKIVKIIATDIEENDLEGYQNLIIETDLPHFESGGAGIVLGKTEVLFFDRDSNDKLELIKKYPRYFLGRLDIKIFDVNGDGSKEIMAIGGGVRTKIFMENIISGEKFILKGGKNNKKEMASCGFGDDLVQPFFIKDLNKDGIYEYAVTEEGWEWWEDEPMPAWEFYKWKGGKYHFYHKEKITLDELKEEDPDLITHCQH